MIEELNDEIYSENFYPCKYVEYNKEAKEWKVGTIIKNAKDEYMFSAKDYMGKLDNTSLEFALKLLEMYKFGGKKLVKSWLSRNE